MKATQLYRKHNGENRTYPTSSSLLSGRRTVWTLNPIDYAVLGALQQNVYRVSIVDLENLKDRVRTCWASLDQELITKPFVSGDRD